MNYSDIEREYYINSIKEEPIKDSIKLLKRGEKIIIKSNINDYEWLNIPLMFVNYNKYLNRANLSDYKNNIYMIDINKFDNDNHSICFI
ncbi:MAG: hypothetical protein WDA02_10275 [Saccharofermentanales bacterium]